MIAWLAMVVAELAWPVAVVAVLVAIGWWADG